MTITKAAAGFLGAFLIFLLGKWAAAGLYHVGGHGDEAAYVIEVEEAESAEAEEEVSFAELMASADVDKGSKVFKKCSACHKLEKGANATGPYLYGVVGRPIASVSGFGYSDTLSGLDGEWTPEHLSEFLTKPSAYAPGTSMSFAGLNKIGDRVDLIAFLNANSDSPYVIEASSEEAATEEAPAEEAATEEAPAEEAATEEAPAEAPATEEAPAEEAATEEAPAEEAATEEAPAEETATEEAPAEEAATEEAPAEEATTEEAPAEETATEEASEQEAATEEAATHTAAVAGDVEAGSKVFKKCAACHKLEDGKNGIGPHLYGIIGRPVATVEGFKYTDALSGLGGEWTPDRLDAYLTKPRDFAPGTTMSFAGLRKEEDRTNVIAYLDSIDN